MADALTLTPLVTAVTCTAATLISKGSWQPAPVGSTEGSQTEGAGAYTEMCHPD